MSIDEYAVYGAKKNAQTIRRLVKEHFHDKRVTYFIENLDFNKIGSIVSDVDDEMGTPVISLYHFAELYHSGKVKGALIPSEMPVLTMRTMKRKLVETGIPEESIFVVPINAFRKQNLTYDEARRVFTRYNELVQIYDLYINTIEYCNLNCRSCATCCNLTEHKLVYELDRFEKDMCRLHELVPNIVGLGLAGGEPLLLDNICDYVAVVRALYPYGGITVTTNGILLQKLSREKLDKLATNNVTIRLSLYPSLRKNLDENLELLQNSGIPYYVSDYENFYKRYTLEPYFDKRQSFERCGVSCTGFRNGRISCCEMALFTGKINSKFRTMLPEYSGIDIHNPSLTSKKLMQELEKPLELCRWCTEGLMCQPVPWSASKGDDVPGDYFLTHDEDVFGRSL